MTSAIIVAAGRGTRMGPNIDKLFLEVAGAPVVAHTWRLFDSSDCIDDLILVVREGRQAAFDQLASRLRLRKAFRVVHGGKERQAPVWNGLQAPPAGATIVAIQDGARPCTPPDPIQATVDAARKTGA